jgi:acyl carrier protein phosphodiesterase
MNFLAHLYLAGEDEEIIFGNFIADAVKGNSINGFNDGIKNGILLHREIDSFTDNHPVVKESIKRLRPKYRMFSGVIVDIYYDHYLAKYWDDFSDCDLRKFVSGAYSLLIRKYGLLPARSKRILPFMITQNWLVGYSNFYSLERVFKGMSRRTRFLSGMENAVEDLKRDYSAYEDEFRQFFPDIIEHVEKISGKVLQIKNLCV